MKSSKLVTKRMLKSSCDVTICQRPHLSGKLDYLYVEVGKRIDYSNIEVGIGIHDFDTSVQTLSLCICNPRSGRPI